MFTNLLPLKVDTLTLRFFVNYIIYNRNKTFKHKETKSQLPRIQVIDPSVQTSNSAIMEEKRVTSIFNCYKNFVDKVKIISTNTTMNFTHNKG